MADDARTKINAVGWTLGSISTVVIALRVYARTVLSNKFGWDDGLMIFAWVTSIVTTAMVTVGTQHGFGTHQHLIQDKHDQEEAVKYTLIPSGITLFASAAAKISVVIFLFRLLGRAAQLYHKIILIGASVVMIAANTVSWSFLFGYCDPPEKAWKPELDGTCKSGTTLDITARVVSAYNAFMDLLCAAFAIILVCSLNMKRSTKLGLAVLMGGGIFGAAATIAKIVVMGNIKDTPDMTWSWTPIAYWYLAEMHVLVIAGSVPMLRPVLNKVRGKDYSSYYPGGSGPDSKPHGNRFRGTGSKSSNAVGHHTLALRDFHDNGEDHGHETTIDGRQLDEARSSGGSSVENILPKQHPSGETQDYVGFGRNNIKVTNEVVVGYT